VKLWKKGTTEARKTRPAIKNVKMKPDSKSASLPDYRQVLPATPAGPTWVKEPLFINFPLPVTIF
jgi:hypothetical protein